MGKLSRVLGPIDWPKNTERIEEKTIFLAFEIECPENYAPHNLEKPWIVKVKIACTNTISK